MELIPIIKYALEGVLILSFFVVSISYILYKVKKDERGQSGKEETGQIPEENHEIPEQTVKSQISVAAKKEKINTPPKRNSRKRFTVINEQKNVEIKSKFNYKAPKLNFNANFGDNDRRKGKGLNLIYNNYEPNNSEPLKKYGL